jgi:hypothetical protein
VRRIDVDLAALGAHVWIDEAELNIGDSLIGKIAAVIDEMEFLAVVLSPDAVAAGTGASNVGPTFGSLSRVRASWVSSWKAVRRFH